MHNTLYMAQDKATYRYDDSAKVPTLRHHAPFIIKYKSFKLCMAVLLYISDFAIRADIERTYTSSAVKQVPG